MKVAIITGVPGVGKTSLCSKIQELYSEQIVNVNFGDFLSSYREANKRENECDSSFLDYLRSLQKDIIVDSHGIERLDFGIRYSPFLNIYSPYISCFVLIKAEPHTIHKRKSNDLKQRVYETIEEIQQHQELLEKELLTNSIVFGVKGYIIDNENSFNKSIIKLEQCLHDSGFLVNL